MINNNGMYFNYGNPFNCFNMYPGGCCMQGGFMPRIPLNENYQRFNQPNYGCPAAMQSMQYSPTAPCFSGAGNFSFMEDKGFTDYINPSQLKMRTVSIEEIME